MTRHLTVVLALTTPFAACDMPHDELSRADLDQLLMWNAPDDAAGGWHDAVVRVELGGGTCTGTLLTPSLVLTASHCIHGSGTLEPCTVDADCAVDTCQMPEGECGSAGATSVLGETVRIGVDVDNDITTKTILAWVTADGDRTKYHDDVHLDMALLAIDPLTPSELDVVFPHRPTRQASVEQFMPAQGMGYGTVETGGLPRFRQVQTWDFGDEFELLLDWDPPGRFDSTVRQPWDSIAAGDSGGPMYRLLDERDLTIREQVGIAHGGGPADYSSATTQGQAAWASVADDARWDWLHLASGDHIYRAMGLAPHPMGRWYGEVDYSGPCRPSADADCDRVIDDPQRCPAIFAEAGRSTNPRSPNAPSSELVLFGELTANLNDRVHVYGSTTEEWGDVAAAAVHVRNDVKMGTAYGVGWKSRWGWRSTAISMGHRSTMTDAITGDVGAFVSSSVPLIGGTTRLPEIVIEASIPGGHDVWLEPDRAVSLPPGDYGKLMIKSRSRVVLQSGVYTFTSFTMELQSVLDLGTDTAPVVVHVRDSIKYEGSIVGYEGTATEVPVPGSAAVTYDTSRFLVAYYGMGTAHLNQGFRGVFVAPHAKINAASKWHVGALYGRQVEVHQGSRVLHRPFGCRL